MKSKVIKEPLQLLKYAEELKPTSFKLLLYILIYYPPHKPFKLTQWEMSQATGIKNPSLAVLDLIERNIIQKKQITKSTREYTLLVDLINWR